MKWFTSRENIQDFLIKCKGLAEDGIEEWGLFAIILLVGLSSFGLGRISVLEEARPVVSITQAPRLAHPRGMYVGGLYVASRSGMTYYYPWCGGVQKLAAETEVWFKTEAEARAAGYSPAKNCRGLDASTSAVE